MLLEAKKKFGLKESTKPDVDTALFQWFTWNSDNSNFLLIQSFCWDIEIRIMWTTLYYTDCTAKYQQHETFLYIVLGDTEQ